jgi:hypothetical protein
LDDQGQTAHWWETWGDHLVALEETVDLGHGVVFVCVQESGRVPGGAGRVEQRRGWAIKWVRGAIARQEAYLDPDKGRAAAERLAEERE